jgi:hypothetical protein
MELVEGDCLLCHLKGAARVAAVAVWAAWAAVGCRDPHGERYCPTCLANLALPF